MFNKGFLKNERGTAAIEFAMIMPVFIIIVLGIFCFGWLSHQTNNIRYALVEGTRMLQLNPTMTQGQLQTFVRNRVQIGGVANNINVTVANTVVNGVTLSTATAVITLEFQLPLLDKFELPYNVAVVAPRVVPPGA